MKLKHLLSYYCSIMYLISLHIENGLDFRIDHLKTYTNSAIINAKLIKAGTSFEKLCTETISLLADRTNKYQNINYLPDQTILSKRSQHSSYRIV